MKLFLVRHGQSTGNVGGMLTGQSDHLLTALGEAQARAAASRLAPLGPMPLYHSDLPRARATAEAIAAAWAGAPAAAAEASRSLLIPDPRLREMDFGDYEGRSWEEFAADEALGAAFADDPYGTAMPGGESVAHIETRVVDAVREILAAHGETDGGDMDPALVSEGSAVATGLRAAEPGANACLVAHDGPIRAILNHYLGVPPEKWWTLSTTHGGVSLLEFSGGWVNVRFVNATSHLDGVERAVEGAQATQEPSGAPGA